MKVKDNLVGVIRVGNVDYISLTDLAKYENPLDHIMIILIPWNHTELKLMK